MLLTDWPFTSGWEDGKGIVEGGGREVVNLYVSTLIGKTNGPNKTIIHVSFHSGIKWKKEKVPSKNYYILLPVVTDSYN